VVAIGNAPTALLALLDLIEHDGIRPALVVGMPVGFVRAAESKAELMKHQTPYITIEGTRGGSTLAAATVNALLRLAQK
jgi:precorrin-8X/cobalt-precorrin-8 methylmutase